MHKLFVLLFLFLYNVTFLSAQEDLYFNAGIRAMRDDRTRDAITYLEQSYENGSNNPETYLALGLLYLKADESKKAVTLLEEAKQKWEAGELVAQDDTVDYQTTFELNLANAYFSNEDYDEALDLYNQLFSQNIYLRDVYLNRGNTYLEQEEYLLAADDYEAYLASFDATEMQPEQQGKLEKLIPILRRLGATDSSATVSEEDILDKVVRSLHSSPDDLANPENDTETAPETLE